MIEHIVLIKKKPEVTEAEMQPALDALRALKDQIPGIREMTVGTNFSERSDGYTHAVYARFVDRDALLAYQPHPSHRAAVEKLAAVSEARVVVDYEI